MFMVKPEYDGAFHRAHHSTQFIKDRDIIVVSGGMLVPENPYEKVKEWFEINNFAIFKIDFNDLKVILLKTVKVEVDIPGDMRMQGVASTVFGSDMVFCGGFIQPSLQITFNQSPQVNQTTFLVNFDTLTSAVLDRSENGQTAQATLHVLDATAVALVGGSNEALRILTTKSMAEEQPCCYGDKCKVFNKVVKSEIEQLEISCDNHKDTFSHVLCDPELKFSIPLIKRKVKAGQSISYSCPICKGLLSDKRKKR